VAPEAPVITAPVEGAYVADATPTVSGTGHEVGDTVMVYVDGELACEATVLAGLTWSCKVLTALSEGEHSVIAVAVDEAGNESDPSVEVKFTVDTVVEAPVITAPKSGYATSEPTITVSGSGEAGATVTVVAGEASCTAVVGSDGEWSCELTLVEGDYSVTASQVDLAGNESLASGTVAVTIDWTAPQPPTIGGPTGFINTGTPTVSGSGSEPGNTITVSDELGDTLCVATAQADGTWSCTVTVTLPDGTYTLSVVETDAAGNVSDSAEVTFTVDTVAPPAPVIDGPSGLLNTGRPQISGTGTEPGNTITVSDGSTTACTAEVTSSGTWMCTPDLVDRDYALQAVETDAAGNKSEPSNVVNITVDTTAPTPPKLNPSDGKTISGTSEPGAVIVVAAADGLLVAGCEAVVAGIDGKFLCVLETPLEVGAVVWVTATDQAGNTSDAAKLVITSSKPGGGKPGVVPTGGSVYQQGLFAAVFLMLLGAGVVVLRWRRRLVAC